MKKTIQIKLVLLTTLFLSWHVAAQNTMGGKLGLNIATWVADEEFTEESDLKYMTGTNLGMFFQIYGFSNLFDTDDEDSSVRNRGVGITTGIMVPF